jgi:death-on-curing protein
MASTGLVMLTPEEVLKIHEVLVADFAASGDPISPPGPRSLDLLASAVSRQHAGLGQTLKYPDPVDNAATLMYGVCLDHPFHNGNKRTALVAMLVHLDKNHMCLQDTSQKELYGLVKGVASHTFGVRTDKRRPEKEPPRRPSDEEVSEISRWLKPKVFKLVRGEKPVPYRQLRTLLERRGYTLADPHSNMIDVIKIEHQTASLLRKARLVRKRIGSMGYRDEGTTVSLRDMKLVRRMCRLSEEDGVDSLSFYTDDAVIDAFVNKYRTLLRRLART